MSQVRFATHLSLLDRLSEQMPSIVVAVGQTLPHVEHSPAAVDQHGESGVPVASGVAIKLIQLVAPVDERVDSGGQQRRRD